MVKGEGDADVPGVRVDFGVASLGGLQQLKTASVIYFYFPKEMEEKKTKSFLLSLALCICCFLHNIPALSLCGHCCFPLRSQLGCCLLWEAFPDSPTFGGPTPCSLGFCVDPVRTFTTLYYNSYKDSVVVHSYSNSNGLFS